MYNRRVVLIAIIASLCLLLNHYFEGYSSQYVVSPTQVNTARQTIRLKTEKGIGKDIMASSSEGRALDTPWEIDFPARHREMTGGDFSTSAPLFRQGSSFSSLEMQNEFSHFKDKEWGPSSSMLVANSNLRGMTTGVEAWSSPKDRQKTSWGNWDTSYSSQLTNLGGVQTSILRQAGNSLGNDFGGFGARTRLTPGSIVFVGENGEYSHNGGNLFWDETNNRLGIGTSTPSAFLDIAAPKAEAASIHLGASTGVNPSAPTIGDLWFNGSNLFFQKDANTALDLLAGKGYFTIQQDGIELEERSVLNFIGGGVECADNVLGDSTDCLFLRGISVHDVTYDELVGLIADKNLTPGDQYRLTDFRTRYTIPYTDFVHVVHNGETEVLVLTANGSDSLNILVVSEDFPQDIIHYTVRNDILNDTVVDRGYILYRKDTVKNVEAWEDFRNMVFRRWETEVGNGVYAKLCQSEAPVGAGYKDFPMFADYDNLTSEVSINHHRFLNSEKNELSNIVFMGEAYKVRFPDGAQDATFLGNANNCSFGFCSSPTFYGDVRNVDVGENNRLIAYGSLNNTYIRRKGSLLVINGDLTNVEVLASYTGEEINGDHSDETFGQETNEEIAASGTLSADESIAPVTANSLLYSSVRGTDDEELLAMQRSLLQEQEDTLSGLKNEMNDLSLQANINNKRLGLTENIIEALGHQLDELKDTIDMYFQQISLSTIAIADLKETLGLYRVHNSSDVAIAGNFSAERIETEKMSVRSMDDTAKTIGQSVICPEYFELDSQGECTVLQIDSNNDFIEDMTGNRINDGKSAVVFTSAVHGQSRIFLTPRRVIDSPVAVTDIYDNEAFQVEINSPVSGAIVFDWWIVEER